MELRSRVIGNKKRHLEEESDEQVASEDFVALIELDYDEVMDRLFPPSTPQIPEKQIGQFIEGFKKYQESYLKEKKTTKKSAEKELQTLYNNRLHSLRIELLSNKKRRATSSAATTILKTWMTEHVSNPYPTSTELAQLMTETGLSALQISNWMM